MVRVMIVDDDKYMHSVFERILRATGHDVIDHAYNGQEAVEKIRSIRQQLDIILMDHRMPIKNGIAATRELLKDFPSLKILFVSADESVRDEALEVGAIGFLSKPIRSKHLLAFIDEVIGQRVEVVIQ